MKGISVDEITRNWDAWERVGKWRVEGKTWREIEAITGVSNSTLLRGFSGQHRWRPGTVDKILSAPYQPKLL